MTVSWPRDLTFEEDVPSAASTGDVQTVIGESELTGTVNSVTYIPAGSLSGVSGNNRTLTLFNRGSGAGTIALATLALVSGENLTDNTRKTIPLGSSGNLNINVNDILEWDSTHNSSGIADPGGRVIVTMAMRS